MSCPTFTVGQTAELEARCVVDDALTDPAEMTVTVKQPDGSTVVETYNGGAGNVIKSAVGVYVLLFAPTQTGLHFWQAASTTPNGLAEDEFQVNASQVT